MFQIQTLGKCTMKQTTVATHTVIFIKFSNLIKPKLKSTWTTKLQLKILSQQKHDILNVLQKKRMYKIKITGRNSAYQHRVNSSIKLLNAL